MKKWLLIVNGLIICIVLIGGTTRLTHSGLSMVDWRPIMGSIPPLNNDQWLQTFNLYKTSPEYLKLNRGMTLDGFKQIFFWEYFHRMVGRLIGLAIILPYLYFLIRKKLTSTLKKQGFWMSVLVIVQGFAGWFMVKSGLVDNPDVSHFRLAIHLCLAFGLFQLIWWAILDLSTKLPSPTKQQQKMKPVLYIVLGLLVLQIIYGAFTAGSLAGYGFNTFPKMGDTWIAPTAFSTSPLLGDILNNKATIQFIHRLLAFLLVIVTLFILAQNKKYNLTKEQFSRLKGFFFMLAIQFGLGVLTLINLVQLHLALAHQMGALLTLTALTSLIHCLQHQSH